jgi:hypothetical protein
MYFKTLNTYRALLKGGYISDAPIICTKTEKKIT